ncbi:Geranylgeranyl transferase type-1 subunit beta [Habropoda laboriosa]|uniref:Geranylgeranyl transferase type-1 subunit beta n=1 Tax=Habropoda laboriosa TaxID=597456 RepID=A0A0L7RFZ2_9HYME|nr:PREDICTED: geranylgeranyl transferase type-1 subunit beta [Habropoda laboriosa]KOC69770.1 Geranylgeranyl transferase type-1 subunit beta [Habropoda laboriosa]
MPPELAKKKHAKYLQRLLQIMPSDSAEYDCSRLAIAFFAISGLDILNCLDDLSEETKSGAIDWIYRLQITGAGPRSGFQSSTTIPKDAPKYQCGHLAMTYIGLVTLCILGDDLSRVDRKSIVEGIQACQNPDGSFTAIITGCESDMRFLYCACCISTILNDWSGIDKTKAINYILQSISYDGAMGQGPGLESHGGSTFCAVASLFLMNELHNVLTEDQLNRLKRWCLMRQDGGFHGRPGKPSDTCYSFWVGATLEMLDISKLSDPDENRAFLLETQDSILGGFAKFADYFPDPLHTYLGLCGLSLLGETDLCIMNAALNISDRAYKHLLKLHETW